MSDPVPAVKIVNASDPLEIEKAALVLKGGGLVAFPTETVYGLGADAFNPKAVARVFEVKKRPTFDPLIVHVGSPEEAASLWTETPEAAKILMKKFWPGPLTLVLPKNDKIPDIVNAGLPTVAVRMPDHPAALALIRALGNPIAAPSANYFGYTSATTAADVSEDLGSGIDLVLDGGPTRIGIESTVLKIENGRCLLLRPGGIPVEEIEKHFPVVMPIEAQGQEGALESPGTMKSHYAPWTPFILLEETLPKFLDQLKSFQDVFQKKGIGWPRIGLVLFSKAPQTNLVETIEILSAKGDLHEAAANLFQAMRKLDKMHLDLMVAEPMPEKGVGYAVMDRLRKASAGNEGIGKFFEERSHE